MYVLSFNHCLLFCICQVNKRFVYLSNLKLEDSGDGTYLPSRVLYRQKPYLTRFSWYRHLWGPEFNVEHHFSTLFWVSGYLWYHYGFQFLLITQVVYLLWDQTNIICDVHDSFKSRAILIVISIKCNCYRNSVFNYLILIIFRTY